MSKQTITEKSLVIRREKRPRANTKIRVADVIDDLNETKADKIDIPKKTSNLENDGADGTNPYITAQSILGYVPLEGTTEPITGDLEFRGYDSGMFKENQNAYLKVWMEDDRGWVKQNFDYIDKANPTIRHQISIDAFSNGIYASKYFGAGSAEHFVQRRYLEETTLPQPEDDGNYIISKVDGDILFVETATKTSDFVNDGDGTSPFVTLDDIPDTDISGKLDKPTTDGSWVVTKAGNQITYTSANNFGQNIANSPLTSIAGSGMTLGAPYTWNAAGQPFYITNLPDKSADSTFTRLKVQNSSGQEAVVTNPYQVLRTSFLGMSAAQALELGQLLNGGAGSAGAMSVNLISPPIVQQIDSIEYILLRGTNLNLNATSKKIEIRDAVTKALVVTIPDSQIQLSSDGLTLIFYYNFKDFITGEFIIRLTSGVKVYDTNLTLKTVLNIDNINLDALTYDIIYASDVTPSSSDVAIGRNVAINTPTGELLGGAIPKVSIKSSEIFAQGDDFYLEFTVNIGAKSSSNTQDGNTSYIGVGYSSTPNVLVPSSLIHFNYNYSNNNEVNLKNNNIVVANAQVTPLIETIIVIKTGNLFRTIVRSTNHQITLSNNSGYSLFLNIVGRTNGTIQAIQTQILKAYTFN